MAQVDEQSATTEIYDITHQCLEAFIHIANNQDESLLTHRFVPGDDASVRKDRTHSSRDFLGLHNSFTFWIDYTAALSLMDSSLDVRLHGLTDIQSMVVELLEMILRNLQRIDIKRDNVSLPANDPAGMAPREPKDIVSKWEDASRAIDSALDRLHFIAAAIRKASAKKLEYNITTFLTEEDIVFRRDVSSLVRFRFPAARKSLCQQLGDSIAARRRMLLLQHRHAKKLTIRRNVSTGPGASERHQSEPNIRPAIEQPLRVRMVHNLSIQESNITKASRPDPGAAALKHLQLPQSPRPVLTTLMSTVMTTRHDSFEYPSPPKVTEGESRVQCPYCLKPLRSADMERDSQRAWTHHVDDDIKPYSCLFPECAKALMFFTRRHEWKSHMENAHSKDWARNVHALVWFCDIDHKDPERFETDSQWREHMKDPASHPQRSSGQPTTAQLDALAPRKQQVALREPFVCPLCEQIPEKIRPQVERGVGNPEATYEYLSEHIANHIKSLSLLSLPCLDGSLVNSEVQSVSMQDSSHNLLKEGSVAQPPSRAELLDGSSAVPELWSTAEQEELTTIVASNASSLLDQEFLDYIPSEKPPDMLNFEWLEALKKWKGDSDIIAGKQVDSDPILIFLQRAKLHTNEKLRHEDQPPDDSEEEYDTDTDSDDDSDYEEELGALQETSVLDIFRRIRASGDQEVVVDGLDLYKKLDRDQFMEKNKAFLDKETSQDKRNLLHLFADEMSERRSATKIKRLKKFIIELARLPANLLAKKDAGGNTPMHSALRWGNARLARYMCVAHKDADSILKIPVANAGKQSGNCLHLAIKNGDQFKYERTDLLDLLIKKTKKETLCATDEEGFTPLHLAVAASRCDDAQLATVKALVNQCDEALDIMCMYRGTDLVSPYRYHVLTKEALNKHTVNPKPIRVASIKYTEATEGSPEKSTQKPFQKAEWRELKFRPQATSPETGEADETRTMRKEHRFQRAELTESSILAIGQYLKEYCLRTRDHDKAVELLYGSRQHKQIYLDLNGTRHNWTTTYFLEDLRHIEFQDELQYVALRQMNADDDRVSSKRKPGQRLPGPDENEGTNLETLFEWLKYDKKVETICRIIVDDLQDPSHTDEVIESCFRGIKGLEMWDWRKFDVSPEVIQEVAPQVQVVHLYWSGNNAVLRAWSEGRGIRQLKHLKTVHLHSKQGLESRSRIQKYIEEFKSDVETDTQIRVEVEEIQTQISPNALNDADAAAHIYERHKWVTTMEEFADFLQNAENATEPKVELLHPVKVALLDDGVDVNDPTIQTKVFSGKSFCYRDKEQILNQPWYASGSGHGTAMASFIGKICPNVQLYVLRLDEKASAEPGRRSVTAESAEKAVTAAIEEEVDIISMSWTINRSSDNEASIERLESAIAKAARKNILMFCTASDQGLFKDNSYPAATTRTSNIFKIGAAMASGQAVPSFGDPSLVDFIFPGHQITNERSKNPNVRSHTVLTGSSLATALASGLAAVILYCVQLSAIASSQDRSTPDLSRYLSLKNHESMKKTFLQIGTTDASKNKYITVWERFEQPVRDAENKSMDTWIDCVVDLAKRLTWDASSR